MRTIFMGNKSEAKFSKWNFGSKNMAIIFVGRIRALIGGKHQYTFPWIYDRVHALDTVIVSAGMCSGSFGVVLKIVITVKEIRRHRQSWKLF